MRIVDYEISGVTTVADNGTYKRAYVQWWFAVVVFFAYSQVYMYDGSRW